MCIYALLGIKNAAEKNNPQEDVPENPNVAAFIPLTFQDYLTAMQSEKMCQKFNFYDLYGNLLNDAEVSDFQRDMILENSGFSIDENGNAFNISGIIPGFWPVPTVKCDARLCQTVGQDAQPFCEYSILGVAASTSQGQTRARQFREYVQQTYPVITSDTVYPFSKWNTTGGFVRVFDSPEQIDDYVQDKNYGVNTPKLAMAVVWGGEDENVYAYSLRPNSTNFNAPESAARPATRTTPNTEKLTNDYARNDNSSCTLEDGTPYVGPMQNSCAGQYAYNGVLTFQRLVHDFILVQNGVDTTSPYQVVEAGVSYAPYPSRFYRESGFLVDTEDVLPLFVVLGLLYPVAAMVGMIVREKELRQKELMKMMSVTESDIGWSWFVSFLIFHIITIILFTYICSLVWNNSDLFIILFFWFITFVSLIAFCQTIASLFSKTVRAVLIALLATFGGFFLPLAVDYSSGNKAIVLLISLHPVSAYTYGLKQIGRLEGNGVGLTVDSIAFTENVSGYSFQDTLRILIIDSILWGILSWYLNRVIRPDYGAALPLYFPFTLNYWCPGYQRDNASSSEDNMYASVEEKVAASGIPYEPVSDALKRQAQEGKSIEIRDLRKHFGEKVAVDGLNLSIYNGQITALLGHNGKFDAI